MTNLLKSLWKEKAECLIFNTENKGSRNYSVRNVHCFLLKDNKFYIGFTGMGKLMAIALLVINENLSLPVLVVGNLDSEKSSCIALFVIYILLMFHTFFILCTIKEA